MAQNVPNKSEVYAAHAPIHCSRYRPGRIHTTLPIQLRTGSHSICSVRANESAALDGVRSILHRSQVRVTGGIRMLLKFSSRSIVVVRRVSVTRAKDWRRHDVPTRTSRG